MFLLASKRQIILESFWLNPGIDLEQRKQIGDERLITIHRVIYLVAETLLSNFM
jgi:hypothetical protein